MKKKLLLALILFSTSDSFAWISSNSKHDPYPVFTTLDPHTFLYRQERQELMGYETISDQPERFGISISPFGQNADFGKSIRGKFTELGDINGKWSMIPLLYGDLPKGKVLPPTLQEAQINLFPGGMGLNDPNLIDPEEKFGFFTIPTKYRKRGLRFELDFNIIGDFGIAVQGGIADICHTATACPPFRDLTCNANLNENKQFPNNDCDFKLDKCEVQKFLMDKLKLIADELDCDLSNFHEVSSEEFRFHLYWRHAFEINADTEEYSEFLFIPFLNLSGSVSPGRKKDPREAFALSFGNNDHNALGFSAGLNFDFYDTIEIGGEIGLTHFFKKDFTCVKVPNSLCQSGIYPFSTDITVKPGHNWHFGGKISAYHFLEHLSFWFQYIQVQHRDDEIELKCPDPAFKPKKLEDISTWKVKLANIGFNYDISPNISLGFLWQAPLSQRNVFRSTTVMFSFSAFY